MSMLPMTRQLNRFYGISCPTLFIITKMLIFVCAATLIQFALWMREKVMGRCFDNMI